MEKSAVGAMGVRLPLHGSPGGASVLVFAPCMAVLTVKPLIFGVDVFWLVNGIAL